MNIGKVVSINFNQFKVKIFSEITGGSVNLSGDTYYFGNIGSYLKAINALGESIICEVISIFDSDLYNEKKEIKKKFGEKVKMYRNLAKLTQEQLAEKCGCSPQTISGTETGYSFPSSNILSPNS